jgi:3-oxoacyl-[acyl-carrier-protein] synthase II
LTTVVADLARRKQHGEIAATLEQLWSKLPRREGPGAIITGATGAEPATSEERVFLKRHAEFPVRATGTMFGHTMETQFPLGIALAALSLSRGTLFPPNDPAGLEIEMKGAPTQIVVVGAGHWRGEGMALVEAVS